MGKSPIIQSGADNKIATVDNKLLTVYIKFTVGMRGVTVADQDKEILHECTYRGSHYEIQAEGMETEPKAPSSDFARTIALAILGGRVGKYRSLAHFKKRMIEREFDVFDMEYAIRNGSCVCEGEFSEDYRSYKYTFRAAIEGCDFDAVFALLADHEFTESPTMLLITGCFKTKSGKRKSRY